MASKPNQYGHCLDLNRRRAALREISALGATFFIAPFAAFAADMLVASNEEEKVGAATQVEEVRQFLTAYNEAFETLDAAKIAVFYHVPIITVRGDGSIHCFQSLGEIEKFFGGVAAKYSADGYHSGTFYDLEVVPIGSRSVLATLTWEQWRSDKSTLRKWRHSYNLVKIQGDWRILASTFHLT